MKVCFAERRIVRSPIKAALATAQRVVLRRLPANHGLEVENRIARLDQEIGDAKSIQNTLLGVEKSEHVRLQEQIIALEKRRAPLRSQLERISHQRRMIEVENERLQKYCGKYHRMDLMPLRWRNAAGFPLLALFSLNNNKFKIRARRIGDGWGRFETRDVRQPKVLPSQLHACYDDVYQLLEKMSLEKRKTVTLEAQFVGAIPFEEKAKINRACQVFEGVYILAEVSKWKLKETAPTVIKQSDPLVVGWDGRNLWLVTSFDTTTIEKYVEQVHAGRQLEETKN